MDRLTNYFFGLLIIYLFIMEGRANDHLMILTGLGLSMVIAYLAFLLKWITLDAVKPVIILGTVTLGFGGWWLALALIYFFLSSSLLSMLRKRLNPEEELDFTPGTTSAPDYRRDGFQVWANGFWLATFVTVWFLTGIDTFWIASLAVIAAATSDTWATEIGTIRPGKTRRIDTFRLVEPGTDGGISFKGILAALLGSFSTALFILPVFGYIVITATIVFVSGFLGSLIDSMVGAVYQNREENELEESGGHFSRSPQVQRNNLVNWVATGTGGLLTLIILNIISL
ncbi:DUF92 domain-containing protein [Rhodohalobacter mucosus]|uniref:TIGR00297 family protein n=1 Tax=Rhodohalobacter mucosus TaxID=2079485 RepID=A0A316TU24_9BACT|nr:DUF92 domain-containing protein [Rhodohalobacter mucosus]PWN07141.1 hypothetical protein DDZ15_07715 [Rhodohalobacter mucosus]